MPRKSTEQSISDLELALEGYIDDITAADDRILAVRKVTARNALNAFLDASRAYMNVNASAASSYSTAIGSSVQKRAIDDARAAKDAAWSDFVEACALGGVTVPSGNDSVAYWDLSTAGI